MRDGHPGALHGALRNRSRSAIALCYHSIAAPGPPWTSVGPDLFERQLAALRRHGYGAARESSLTQLASGARPERRLALLTFDDGYVDNHATAYPLLRAYGMTATFFLLPPFVDTGAPLIWPEVEDRAATHPEVMRSLTWPQVGEMAEGGCEFGSHGLTHRAMPELSDEDLHEELWESRRRIKERLGSCETLAYPFGEWSPRVAAAATAAGYRWAYSLPFGAQHATTPMSIPRVPVDHRDGDRRFAAKLTPIGRRVLLSPLKGQLRHIKRRPL
ncbi:MAG: polysaccharide deacetylase family protein [Thermoleophilaceae bacterium]